MQNLDNPSMQPFSPPPKWLLPKKRERVLRISERMLWAIVWSVLWHLLIIVGIVIEQPKTPPPSKSPLNVVLDVGLPIPDATNVIEPPNEPPPAKPESKPKPTPTPKPKVLTAPKLPKEVMTQTAPKPFSVPEQKTETMPQPKATPTPPAPDDFSAMLKRKQAQRLADEMAAKRENDAAAAAEKGPTEDELRTQKIMNNIKFGTNGLFNIQRIDPYNASFSFKGWTSDYSSANTQYYEVQSNNGEDIRLVVVRRMIALIREHYDGDFVWKSHRLNRDVTLSARKQDGAGLEDFLMKEFFGERYKQQ